jgi:hypothetical protein
MVEPDGCVPSSLEDSDPKLQLKLDDVVNANELGKDIRKFGVIRTV